MPNIDVIDLSHHNTISTDLVAARNAGVKGVIHKATEGFSFVDEKLEARAHLARQAGMLFGVYHFMRPGSVSQQVNHFLTTITPVLDDRTLVACDFEDASVSFQNVEGFLGAVEEATHRTCVLYAGGVLKDEIAAGQPVPQGLKERRLWLAQYGPKPELPKGWTTYWLWQFTDKASVPGISPCDASDYPHGIDMLEQEWSGRDPQPAPEDIPSMQITTNGKPLQIIVDGKLVYPV